jgi:hypothetical protein
MFPDKISPKIWRPMMKKCFSKFLKAATLGMMLVLALLSTGCKLTSEMVIEYVQAKAIYEVQENITTISLWVRMENGNSALANIKDWSFTIKEGDEVLLVINKDNFKEVLGESLYHFTDFDILDQGSVYVDNWSKSYCRPYFGDLFNGREPNQVDVTVDIRNGKEYQLSGTYPFTMVRQ